MLAYQLALAATVVLLFPMIYFAFVSLAFFLRSFKDPTVAWMLARLFNGYFTALTIIGALAALAFTLAGHGGIGAVIGLLAALAAFGRRMVPPRVARWSGAGQFGALRRAHLTGIGYNLAQLVGVIASIPTLFAT